jgi:hypothetical protein
MTLEQGIGFPTAPPTEKYVPTPAEEAKQDIVALMREAKPKSPQSRAVSDIVRWYKVAIFRGNESIEEYLSRQDADRSKIQTRIHRKIARSSEYEEEHDFALVMIERYTYARSKELIIFHGSPKVNDQYLQSMVGIELKEMEGHAKRKINTPTLAQQEK